MPAGGLHRPSGGDGGGREHVRALAQAVSALTLVSPAPKHSDLLPCATEKELFFLPPDVAVGEALPITAELEDLLEEAMDSDVPVLTLEITSPDELENFAACQVLITKPLCLRCADAELLEQALRLYQGRVLYDGPLGEADLRPLAKKYGLIY